MDRSAPLHLERILRQAFHDSLDGIVITGPDTVILDCNEAYERIVGFPREMLIGARPSILRSGKTPRRVFQQMWRDLKKRGRWMGELINRRRNGEEWHCFLSVTRLTDAAGSISGYVGIVRDITDRVNLTAEAARRLKELTVTQDVTVRTLAFLAEHKDPDIGGHLRRIQACTRLLAESLRERRAHARELTRDRLEEIVEASVLHDVGKVGIPEGILFKPGRLSPEEFAVMQLHTRIGAGILSHADAEIRDALGVDRTFLTVARQIALHHHERWDGTGYPEGLKGPSIPLPARIVAVADVYDALISRRVYKPAWPHEEAVRVLLEGEGTHFDPDVVRAFREREEEIARLSRAAETEPAA